MTDVHTDIAVIGGGLAAHTAATTLAAEGARVAMIYPSSPGASALWGGLGQAFGPTHPLFERARGQFGAAPSASRAFTTARDDRMAQLQRRRRHHPYWRLGLGRSDIDAHMKHALSMLDYPGWRLIPDERVVPSPDGSPYAPDLAATSVARSAIVRGESVGVVACPAVADWRAERLVQALDEVDGIDAHLVRDSMLNDLPHGEEHPVRVAARIDELLADGGYRLADELGEATSELGLDVLILPPCIGRTFDEHSTWFGALTSALSCRVAEAAVSRWSIHGWRLDRFLRGTTSARVITGRASTAEVRDGRIERVHTAHGPIVADSFILATGRWVGGGLPASAPLRESIFGLDLWLDGAPLADPEEVWPPHLLDELPWRDHSLFRLGVAIDGRLRPLAYGGTAAFDNLFVAGRILAGSNPFLDGTVEGVDLVTGHLAARFALAHTGESTREVSR